MVCTEKQLEKTKEFLQSVSPYDEKAVKPARFILYNCWEAEEDPQGRILIPQNLRQYAKLDKNIIVFKGPACVEIWAEEVWNEYIKDVAFGDLLGGNK